MFTPRPKTAQIAKSRLKLKNGEHFIGVFRGKPHTWYQHWVNNRSVVCTRKTGCFACEGGERGSFRFAVNIIAKENDQWVAKVFEGGSKIWDQLAGLGKEYDLAETKVKITRAGSTKDDTVYTILPTKDFQVDKAVLAELEKVPLNPLEPEEAAA